MASKKNSKTKTKTPTPSAHASKTLQDARKARGLTQKALAAALGVSKSAVINMENRYRRPGLGLALRIEALLGVPCRVWNE